MARFATAANHVPSNFNQSSENPNLSEMAVKLQFDAGMPRDHRKLDAFKLADQLALLVYRHTANFPTAERYGLQSQMRRAAISTSTNIVEGCAREGEGDYLRFLDIAFGSSRELVYLASLATRLSLVNERDGTELHDLGERVAGALACLRRSYGRP